MLGVIIIIIFAKKRFNIYFGFHAYKIKIYRRVSVRSSSYFFTEKKPHSIQWSHIHLLWCYSTSFFSVLNSRGVKKRVRFSLGMDFVVPATGIRMTLVRK